MSNLKADTQTHTSQSGNMILEDSLFPSLKHLQTSESDHVPLGNDAHHVNGFVLTT